MLRCCSLLLILAARAFPADWEAEARRLRPTPEPHGETAVIQNLANRMSAALGALQHPENKAQADQARPALRRALAYSLGYRRLPWPPDLQPRVTSTLQRDGYRIEKIVYQGLPGEWIPAHLYLPDPLRGRSPAVLFYNGHWFPDSKSRPDFQAFCINTEGLLVGVSEQGFAVYDTQVALHYLLTRPEVDPQRIGMTGASGGGFNTWMNAALDDRIAVAVPVVGTADLGEQAIAHISRDWDPNDHCHYIPGLFRYANNHELLAMTAPKPVLIVSAAEDNSFPIRGVRDVAAYGRKLYDTYGLRDRFGYSEDSTEGHGYQIKKREAAYGWFLRWLMNKGDGRPVPEPPTETLPPDAPELRCLPPGQNQAAGPAMVAAVAKIAAKLPPVPPQLRWNEVLGPWPTMPAWTGNLQPGRLQRLLVPVESDLQIPAVLLRPSGEALGLLVALDDRGKEAVLSEEPTRSLVDDGWAVLAVDPRGIGEMATTKNTWLFAISLMMGENFVWRQAWDLHRAIQGVRTTPEFRATRIGLYARGHNASLAATYLIGRANPKFDWFLLRDGFVTYHDFLNRPRSLPLSFRLLSPEDRTTRLDREIPPIYFPFSALEHFDLPQLLAASGVPGLVVNVMNGDWERKPIDAVRRLVSGKLEAVSDDEPDAAMLRYVRGRK
jgi:dienelactone hydrolase